MSELSNQTKAEICRITCGHYPIRHSKECPWHRDKNTKSSPEQAELEALRAQLRKEQAAREQAEATCGSMREVLENFDVLNCVNEATKWGIPPDPDDRWTYAVCKAADLVKRGMLNAFQNPAAKTGERWKALCEATQNLIDTAEVDPEAHDPRTDLWKVIFAAKEALAPWR